MILEDNADFHKIDLLNKQGLLLVFCLSIWLHIWLSESSVIVRIRSGSRSQANIIVYFFIPLLFPFYPTLLWLALKHSQWVLMDDGTRSKHAAEPLRSAHATLIPGWAHGYNINETFHFCENESQVRVMCSARRERCERSAPYCNESPKDTPIQAGQEGVLGACERSWYTVKSTATPGVKSRNAGAAFWCALAHLKHWIVHY